MIYALKRFIIHAYPIILIWVLIAAKFSFIGYIDNEVDVLPSAKQFMNPDWLAKDWYLNQQIFYRFCFNGFIGILVDWFGFEKAALIGRLMAYAVFSLGIEMFRRAFAVRLHIMLIIVHFFIKSQSIIAGESMVGGVETKIFAYAFVLMAMASFFRKHYLRGFLFAGAALSFHVLVGLYALLCTVGGFVLNREYIKDGWQTIMKYSWTFLITGILGVTAIVVQLWPKSDVDTLAASLIYVTYRLPHHLLPSSWQGFSWLIELLMVTGMFLFVFIKSKERNCLFISAYALTAVFIFFIGLNCHAFGQFHLLKYYWFRFADTMAPFLALVLIGLFFYRMLVEGEIYKHVLRRWREKSVLLRKITNVILILIVAMCFHNAGFRVLKRIQSPDTTQSKSSLIGMMKWINENTPNDGVFLMDPTISNFYIYAQRAVFVSFKHSPQSEKEILEWYSRLTLCNGGITPSTAGYDADEELRPNFYKLNESQILNIAKKYKLDYYLGLSRQRLYFNQEYTMENYSLYKIPDK